MHIRVICVGKLRESFMRDGCAEYQKRLGRYHTLEICEVADEPAPEKLSEKQQQMVMAKEAERMRAHLRPGGKIIALDVTGKRMTSIALAETLQKIEDGGCSCLHFVIGGSLGLDAALVREADLRLSLSDMTFPHTLARLVLLEQVYRAAKINHNEPYHK